MAASTANAGSLHVQLLSYDFNDDTPRGRRAGGAHLAAGAAQHRAVEGDRRRGRRGPRHPHRRRPDAGGGRRRRWTGCAASRRWSSAGGSKATCWAPTNCAPWRRRCRSAWWAPISCRQRAMATRCAAPWRVLRLAQRHGARLLRGAEVHAIERDGTAWRVATSKGPVIAGRVVNATGPWAARIGRMVGLDLPVTGTVQQVIVTEPAPPLTRHLIALANRHLSLKQQASGGFLVGGGWFGGFDPASGRTPQPAPQHRGQSVGLRPRAAGAARAALRARLDRDQPGDRPRAASWARRRACRGSSTRSPPTATRWGRWSAASPPMRSCTAKRWTRIIGWNGSDNARNCFRDWTAEKRGAFRRAHDGGMRRAFPPDNSWRSPSPSHRCDAEQKRVQPQQRRPRDHADRRRHPSDFARDEPVAAGDDRGERQRSMSPPTAPATSPDRGVPAWHRSTACRPTRSPGTHRRTRSTPCRRCRSTCTAAQIANDHSIGWRVTRIMPRGGCAIAAGGADHRRIRPGSPRRRTARTPAASPPPGSSAASPAPPTAARRATCSRRAPGTRSPRSTARENSATKRPFADARHHAVAQPRAGDADMHADPYQRRHDQQVHRDSLRLARGDMRCVSFRLRVNFRLRPVTCVA